MLKEIQIKIHKVFNYIKNKIPIEIRRFFQYLLSCFIECLPISSSFFNYFRYSKDINLQDPKQLSEATKYNNNIHFITGIVHGIIFLLNFPIGEWTRKYFFLIIQNQIEYQTLSLIIQNQIEHQNLTKMSNFPHICQEFFNLLKIQNFLKIFLQICTLVIFICFILLLSQKQISYEINKFLLKICKLYSPKKKWKQLLYIFFLIIPPIGFFYLVAFFKNFLQYEVKFLGLFHFFPINAIKIFPVIVISLLIFSFFQWSNATILNFVYCKINILKNKITGKIDNHSNKYKDNTPLSFYNANIFNILFIMLISWIFSFINVSFFNTSSNTNFIHFFLVQLKELNEAVLVICILIKIINIFVSIFNKNFNFLRFIEEPYKGKSYSFLKILIYILTSLFGLMVIFFKNISFTIFGLFLGAPLFYKLKKKLLQRFQMFDCGLIATLISTIVFAFVWKFNIKILINEYFVYFILGFFNCLALLPGMSRMMTTFTIGFLFNMSINNIIFMNLFLAGVTSVGQWILYNEEKEKIENLSHLIHLKLQTLKEFFYSLYKEHTIINTIRNFFLFILLFIFTGMAIKRFFHHLSSNFFWIRVILVRFFLTIRFYKQRKKYINTSNKN